MRRVRQHPVLGEESEAKDVHIYVDGKIITAREGEPIAAALIAAGFSTFRLTAEGAGRSLYCGIGQCNDCIMTVNGIPNVRTCVTPVEEGMQIETQHGVGSGGIDLDNGTQTPPDRER